MSTNLSTDELRERLDGFVRYRQEHLKGDEKGEAAVFLENLFRALGHEGVRQAGATLEKRIKKRDNGGTAYADLEWKPRVLIEMKKAGRDLAKDYPQAFELRTRCGRWSSSSRPRERPRSSARPAHGCSRLLVTFAAEPVAEGPPAEPEARHLFGH
jgi:hypothetical protein